VQRLFRALTSLAFTGLVLAGCATTPQPSNSINGPRYVHLFHPESGERVRTTYWRDGVYQQSAMLDIASLFRDRRTDEIQPVDHRLVDLLYDLRENAGAPPDAPIHVLSGFRSRESNVHLAKSNRNVAENSFHLRGQAADIKIPGVPGQKIVKAAAALRRGGYAVYPGTGHVHVDVGPVRTWQVKY